MGTLVAVALGLVLLSPVGAEAQTASPSHRTVERIDGVSLVAPRRPVPAERMGAVAEVGAGWVAVVPYAFLRPGGDEVVFDRDGQFWGERVEGVRRQIEHARSHGLEVLLKPHVWIRRGGWVGDYAPEDEEGWGAFERSYRAYVLGAARLAEELDVEMLCVGTEMKRIVAERPGLFRRLVSDVREVYGGELTYAANWDSYADVPFWDELDYVGVDAYFPLSGAAVPTVGELERAWRPRVRELRDASRRWDRPILFTEFGYRALAGAAGEQWKLPDVRRTDPARAEPRAQARAYEALFRAWWGEPWFAGGFLWKWYLEEMDGRRGERVLATGYTPQGKPAAEVIARWYGEGEIGR